jgi:hypothetical protein
MGLRIIATVVRIVRLRHDLFHGTRGFQETCAGQALKGQRKTHPKNQQGTHGGILAAQPHRGVCVVCTAAGQWRVQTQGRIRDNPIGQRAGVLDDLLLD